MYRINKKGQSTVEYVLLVAAVIAVMITFTTGNGALFQQHLNSALTAAGTTMQTAGNDYLATNAANPSAAGETPQVQLNFTPPQ